MLRAVADLFACFAKVSMQIKFSNAYLPLGRCDFIRESLESGAFTCTVDTKQRKTLSSSQGKGQIINRSKLALSTALPYAVVFAKGLYKDITFATFLYAFFFFMDVGILFLY